MDLNSFNCPVCYEDYDHAGRLPRTFPLCGHTFCSKCIEHLLTPFGAVCPLDKAIFNNPQISIKDFPTNYALSHLIEERIGGGFCQEHKEETSFVCYTDKKKICNECVWQDGHKTHHIKSLKSIKQEANYKKKELSSVLEDLHRGCQKINQVLETEKTHYLTFIKERFEEFRTILYNKELELLFEVNCIFDLQTSRLDNIIGGTSNFRDTINKKVLHLANLFQYKDFLEGESFFDDVQKYIVECKAKVNLELIEKEIEIIKKNTTEISNLVDTSMINEMKFWSELKFPLTDSLEGLLKHFSPTASENLQWNPQNGITWFKTSTCLSFKQTDGSLHILAETANPSEAIVKLDRLNLVKKVVLDIKKPLREAKDLQFLHYIWKKVNGASEVKITISPNTITKELYQILSEEFSSCLKLDLILEGYSEAPNASQDQVILFLKKLLPKMKNLKKISLNLNRTHLNWNDTEQNSIIKYFEGTQIEEFVLLLEESNITDEAITKIFIPIPSLKRLQLDLNKTAVSSQMIGTLLNSTLGRLEYLEDFSLLLWNTKATDADMSNFVVRSKTLKHFCVDLQSTNITDQSIKCLAEGLATTFETLESFVVGFARTQITDQGFTHIIRKMDRVKILMLSLYDTPISDRSIELFSNNVLVSMEGLERLTLWLQNTKISDVGVASVVSNLKKLKSLELDLSGTSVTNVSMGTLVREVLPKMERLKELEIDVSDTSISTDLKAEIEEQMKRLSGNKRKLF